MRILHLCLGAFYIDNYSYQENMLTKYHARMGHDVYVITSLFTFGEDGRGTYLNHAMEYDNAEGVHVIRLKYRSPSRLCKVFRVYEGLREAITSFNPDLIFSHNVSYADTKVVRDYLKQNPQVRLFADNHADYVNSARNWFSYHVKHRLVWRHYAQFLNPYMEKCYGVTPMRCRFLKEMYHIDSSKIEFLPMGVDDDAIPENQNLVRESIRLELGIGKNDLVVFTGGKIDKLKNTHILVSAIKRLKSSRVHLIICGTLTPQMECLRDSIDDNVNIHYLGWCNASRVINCMVASDIACFPGTHSTLWEQAVGVGLPSVFKRWNEMEHVNVNGNCLFVEGENVDELTEAIKKALDPTHFPKLKEKAVLASQHFLYSNIARRAIGEL